MLHKLCGEHTICWKLGAILVQRQKNEKSKVLRDVSEAKIKNEY